MRLGIAVPQVTPEGGFRPADFRAFLARAEELGFESAWTMEQVLGTLPHLAPLETMTYAAACTERLRLGCAVFVTALHNPVHLAKAIASLDQLAQGRLEVGIGHGGGARMFSAFEVDPATVLARFNESLRVMRALWSGPDVTIEGRFWQLRGATIAPRPAQRPHPPIWFGANRPAALRRAVRHGDGFFGAGSATTAAFASQVETVRTALAETGRDPATFPIAKRVYMVVDGDAARARERGAAALVDVYGDFGRRLAPVLVAGTPDDCVRGLREVADAGAERLLLHPLVEPRDQMERLAAEVVPHLAR